MPGIFSVYILLDSVLSLLALEGDGVCGAVYYTHPLGRMCAYPLFTATARCTLPLRWVPEAVSGACLPLTPLDGCMPVQVHMSVNVHVYIHGSQRVCERRIRCLLSPDAPGVYMCNCTAHRGSFHRRQLPGIGFGV